MFPSIVAILFFLNCQKQDYIAIHLYCKGYITSLDHGDRFPWSTLDLFQQFLISKFSCHPSHKQYIKHRQNDA